MPTATASRKTRTGTGRHGPARTASVDGLFRRLFAEICSPPAPMTVSEWADANIVLDKSAAEPGQFRTDRNPIARPIMDAWADPVVEQITLLGCTQLLKTMTMLIMLGHAIDQDPGPALWVGPREDDVRWFAWNRARPLILESPSLRAQLSPSSDDFTTLEWNLQRCYVRFVWATSPAALSQMPIRYLFLDEVDKYPLFSGREADPISLARERQGTFWNAKTVIASTPTTRAGNIWREYERSQQLLCHVRCPRCGAWQVLTMPQIKGLTDCTADEIRAGNLAFYECVQCEAHIDDEQRLRMIRHGCWAPEKHEITAADEARGHVPYERHVGFWFWRAYSPWMSGRLSEIGAEWKASQRDPAKLMNFVNSALAQPWEEKTEFTSADELRLRIIPEQPEGLVPLGGLVLTAGVDVQKDHFFYVIRAWSPHLESWLVAAARVETWKGLEAALFLTAYPIDDGTGRAAKGKPVMFVRLACVDGRYDTKAVHRFVRRWADVAAATLGRDHLVRPYQLTILDKDAAGKAAKRARKAWHIDTTHYKDLLSRLIHSDPDDPSQWHLFDQPGDDYFQQMCSEHKVVIRSKTTMRATEAWMPVEANAANHFWDCEVYAAAAYDMLRGAGELPRDNQPVVYRPANVGKGRAAGEQAAQVERPAKPVHDDDDENWLPENQDW